MKNDNTAPEVHGPVAAAIRRPFNFRGIGVLVIGFLILPLHLALDYYYEYDFTRNVLIVIPCIVLGAGLAAVGATLTSPSDRAIPMALLAYFIELALYGIGIVVIFGGYHWR